MSVSEVDRETQFQVANEFRNLIKSRDTLLIDGKGFARDVINGAFGDKGGEGMLEYVNGSSKEPIASIIQSVSTKVLAGFIEAEHPQTIAFLFSKMNPDQAATLVGLLAEDKQTDILIRVAGLNHVKADVVDEVREVLRSQLKGSGTDEQEIGGPKAAANILNFFERTNEERVIAEIEEMYPDMAEQIRNLMLLSRIVRRSTTREFRLSSRKFRAISSYFRSRLPAKSCADSFSEMSLSAHRR